MFENLIGDAIKGRYKRDNMVIGYYSTGCPKNVACKVQGATKKFGHISDP